MKKYIIAVLILAAVSVKAQKKTTVTKKTITHKSVTLSSSSLNSLNDSVSYAIGLSVANFYHQQGIKNLNSTVVAKAINDVFSNQKALFTEPQCNDIIMHYLNPRLSKNIEAGQKFLASNKSNPAVKITPSGLQYEVMVQGTGPKPGPTDTVVANYRGTLIDGTEFDNSYKRGQPLTIEVNHVIPGWTEALQLMPVGSKYKLYIPYQLAYGPNDNASIPGGSVLIFEVDLLGIKGK